eukprot:2535209-Rhodomonas_salina.1
MVEGLNSAEQEEGKAVPSARGGARGGAKVGSAEVKTEGRSVTSLAVTGKEWGGSSESPCDVVSFADMFSSSNNTANKNRRCVAFETSRVFGSVLLSCLSLAAFWSLLRRQQS